MNRLARASSPYLRQHAGNPVDWHEWNDEALALARSLDRPILLSIGYAACHWCHVMAHESFEDDEVARAMNGAFVNIKVDREERPDLDRIYQTAHALLTRRSGGWPLTMFLTPDGTPYFGGTYFPKQGRHGLPGFLDLLPRVADAYREQGERIAEQKERLAEAMRSLEPDDGARLPPHAADVALAGLKRTFDPDWGGFGGAPKFPHPFELEFCLRAAFERRDAEALRIVTTTLDRMAEGGIHDHLRGGFCRYSVDAEWSIPHFEKMLYDNGPLLALYAETALATGEPRFAEVARGIVAWLAAEMRADDGAFHSSLDADSEGEEGRFYVWGADEVRAALDDEAFDVARLHFGLDGPPNFEGHAWHLRVVRPLDEVARALRVDEAEARARLARAKARLLEVRARRVRPGLDDKVLTSWNALAIAGLSRAGRALNEPSWDDMAATAVDALRASVWRGGRLYATRRGGEPALPGYLDDHAFLLDALLERLQNAFRRDDCAWAVHLADALLERFEDPARGGFWFTAHDHEALFHRTMPGHDDATPSGNGIAARALARLGALVGDARYLNAARRAVDRFAGAIAHSPGGFSTLLEAAAEVERPRAQAVIVPSAGAAGRAEALAWRDALRRDFRPGLEVYVVDPAEAPPAVTKGAPPSAGARAWVCRGMTCLPPVDTLDGLKAAIA
ncbi:MAG TPA: thioredoxin domain-containing protein [Casimicrobiaceae bacterium]|nr:thioredoxin domain-containing protein [Casimicrobiaceae bacterium]